MILPRAVTVFKQKLSQLSFDFESGRSFLENRARKIVLRESFPKDQAQKIGKAE
jgi:hypothetical protein